MILSSRTDELTPTHLVSIYQTGKGNSYAEFSRINKKGTAGDFRPFTDKDGIWLSKLFKDKSVTLKYAYNPNVLKIERSEIKIEITFKTEPEKQMHIYISSLKLDAGLRPVPGLIWKYNGGLNIWAYKEFKGEETELFKAPFMNTSDGVCLGSTKIKLDPEGHIDINKAIDAVKEGFYASAFSHVTGTPITGNLHELSAELLTLNCFPTSVLLPVLKNNKQLLLKDIL